MTRAVTGGLPGLPGGTVPGPPAPPGMSWAGARRLRWALNDVWVLARRTLTRMMTTPEQLLNVTLQPLLFVLVFSYVFDGAIVLPRHGDYREYLVAGIFAVNMGGTAQGTAIGLAVDLSTGLVDRFRSLPMPRGTVLAGRTLADLVLTLIATAVTAASGLLVGWRIHTDAGRAAAAFGLAMLFAYAAAWAGSCVGMLARSAEAAQAVGLVVLLPLSLTSNAFISTAGMTPWLRDVADWNPVSVLAAACRHLLGNPNPAAAAPAWPMRHPELASALWSLVLIAVLAPCAVCLYTRRGQR